MSALGHKQTFAVQYVMSALPPKADMCGATSDVRFVPEADIAWAKIIRLCVLRFCRSVPLSGDAGRHPAPR